MRNRPIRDVVDHLDLALPVSDGKRVAASAVVQARARVGAAPLEWLFVRTADEWGHASAAQHRWRGLALYGVDGTTLRVPDSDENRAFFGGQPAGDGRGDAGYPQLRLVTLMALRSHTLAAASFGPYGNDERTYAANLWPSVPNDSLTLVDRNYLAATILMPLERDGHNRHWLTRATSKTKWRVVREFGHGDALVELDVSSYARGQDETLPKTWLVRAIEYQHKGHERKVLLTSLTDAERYPADELIALYHERWEIELSFDEVKTELLEREETIRSKNPESVAQEMWGILLAYNLIRLEMARIAAEADVEPTRISFVTALRFIRSEWEWSWTSRSPGAIPKHLRRMREDIARFVLPPRRSERSYPRAVKIKMSNYERNRRGGRLK
jgi:Transposase DDE domain/Insertion element 4 transposase N-terminal